ncbi:hypothetical protein WMY93_000293 [Mugilogobius chulae]|uniref:Ig-like domain-containing protein n=1 Tax=Mugilogobius chulae TaxID=88201 RepID=A0AAW0Q224_9GOBI
MESALCTLLSALVVLLCSSPECKGEDTVSQPAGDVLLTQGELAVYCPHYCSSHNRLFTETCFRPGSSHFTPNCRAQSSRELREEPDSLVVLLCSSPECKGEDTVSQPAGDVLLTQGETVEIECDFQTIDNTPTLFWYKQGRGAPEYMMRKRKSTSNWYDMYKSPKFNEEKFEFKVEAEKNTVSLKIQDVDVTDSAVYYCALRPTVTGNTKTLNKNLWSKDNTILQ